MELEINQKIELEQVEKFKKELADIKEKVYIYT